jgi:hypothetical protein
MKKPRASKKTLEVTIMFEPTRLANKHVAEAYTQVAPVKRLASQYPAPVARAAPAEATPPQERMS